MEILSIEDILSLAIAGETNWKQYGDVNVVSNGKDLLLFSYDNHAAIAHRWNFFERVSRGLIINKVTGEVVARPWAKFFNWGEEPLFDNALMIEATEKMDGSLGILYRDEGEYKIATRGSFNSEQALWATEWLNHHIISHIDNNITLLFEIIYPDNRIVIDYHGWSGLVLIGAKDRFDGRDLLYQELSVIADINDFAQPKVYHFDDVHDIIAAAQHLIWNEEGWVARFSNGQRFKFKGDAYLAAHRIVTGLNYKRVMEAIQAGVLNDLLASLPNEFHKEVMVYVDQIGGEVEHIWSNIITHKNLAPTTSRKDFALYVRDNCPEIRNFMFMVYDNRGGINIHDAIYKFLLERYKDNG